MRDYTGHGWEGEEYDGNLDIKDIAKIVRKELKKEYPDCKFSIRIERYAGGCSLNLSLMEAPFEVVGDAPEECPAGFGPRDFENLKAQIESVRERGYAQLNHYQLTKRYEEDGICNGTALTPKAWKCVRRATQIATGYRRDDSDGMIDYFDTNFYLHLEIGRWDKPFVVKNGKGGK